MIELVYQSLKDYLISLSIQEQAESVDTLGIDLTRDKPLVSSMCSKYLLFDEFQDTNHTTIASLDDSPTNSVPHNPSPPTSLYGYDLVEEPQYRSRC